MAERGDFCPVAPEALPGLGAGPHIHLEGPGGTGLAVQLEIDFGNTRKVDQAALARAPVPYTPLTLPTSYPL